MDKKEYPERVWIRKIPDYYDFELYIRNPAEVNEGGFVEFIRADKGEEVNWDELSTKILAIIHTPKYIRSRWAKAQVMLDIVEELKKYKLIKKEK